MRPAKQPGRWRRASRSYWRHWWAWTIWTELLVLLVGAALLWRYGWPSRRTSLEIFAIWLGHIIGHCISYGRVQEQRRLARRGW